MNRRTLAYPVATLAVVGLLTLGCLRTSAAAEEKSPKAKRAAVESAIDKAPKLRLQFRYQPWKDVLEWFARNADLSLVMDSPPAGTFNYSADREYTPAEAMDLLNNVLQTKGYTLARRGRALMLIDRQPDRDNLVRVYRLHYADPQTAQAVLTTILAGEKALRLAVDPKSNGLIVFGSRETHDKVRNVLKNLDVPTPAVEPETQIKIFTLVYAEPGQAAHLLATLLPRNTHIALAVDERTRSLVASGSRDSLAIAEAVLTRLDVEASRERPKSTANYEVRILWLANDGKGAPPADDLKDVVAEVSRLGIKDVRQVGWITVQTGSNRSFHVTSTPVFAGQRAKLTASGMLSEQSAGAVTMEIAINAMGVGFTATGQVEHNLSEISTRIVMPQRQYVVLATTPVENVTSAFVVHVTSHPGAGGKEEAARR